MGSDRVRAGMAQRSDSPKGAGQVEKSEHLLALLDKVTILLENKQAVTLDIAEELAIPDDPDALLRAARRAHDRYAFWAYQTERARAHVDAMEVRYQDVLGEYSVRYRSSLIDDPRYNVTEGLVKAVTSIDPQVRTALVRLNGAKKRHGLLRSIKEAMHHRCFMMSRLVARYVDMDEG